MRYVIDKQKKYFDDIVTMLRAYNLTQTGDRRNEDNYFYMTIDDVLIGGIKTNLSWNWISIYDIKYDSIEILQQLISHICHFYKGDVVGIKFNSSYDSLNKDLAEIGFSELQSIKYSPQMKPVHYLELRDLNTFGLPTMDVIITEENVKAYDEILEDETSRLKTEYDVDYTSKDLIIASFDKERFAGGIHGIVYDDHMYINLLVVDETYRGKRIGSELMNRIEAEMDDKIKTISLGTVQFQAKGFYEKLGYETIMTQTDLPKGFDCYTLIKTL